MMVMEGEKEEEGWLVVVTNKRQVRNGRCKEEEEGLGGVQGS